MERSPGRFTNPARPARRFAALALTGALAVLAGCSGSSEDGGPPVLPCTDLLLRHDLTSPAAGDVYLQQIDATCTTVDVAVYVKDLGGIFTVGFDLTYPAAQLSYLSYTLGPLLQAGSTTPPFHTVLNPAPGTLQVTGSRLNPDLPVTASGSEILFVIRFQRVAMGTGAVDFDSSGGSVFPEEIRDDSMALVPASFGPGHGGTVLVP
jgi:hypothetical protein